MNRSASWPGGLSSGLLCGQSLPLRERLAPVRANRCSACGQPQVVALLAGMLAWMPPLEWPVQAWAALSRLRRETALRDAPSQEFPPHSAAILELSVRFLWPRLWPYPLGSPKAVRAASLSAGIRNSSPFVGNLAPCEVLTRSSRSREHSQIVFFGARTPTPLPTTPTAVRFAVGEPPSERTPRR